LAERLGLSLHSGDVVALFGELGSGKTVFAQGLAQGLRVPSSFCITSPTFSIVNEYPGTTPFYHVDLYRLRGVEEFAELGLDEIFSGDGVVAIEWPECLGSDLPDERLEVHFRFAGEESRYLTFVALGARPQQRLAALMEFFAS
jgi:tRNA threonylcarbamoyladenosine biosynthesis protein TsaE